MRTFRQSISATGTVTAYLQESSAELTANRMRPAVLILPGGGYQFCSDREAEPVALAYLAEGFNAFILRYAVGPDAPWEQSFEDGTEAITWLREHADEIDVKPDWIAAVGFSAGGHLAASLGTAARERPNALVLGYPVTLSEFGPPVGKVILDVPSAVDSATPPTFLFSTQSDTLVPVRHSVRLLSALAQNEVPFEAHIYLLGAHGMSLAKPATANGAAVSVDDAVAQWLPDSVRFLDRVFGPFPLAGNSSTYEELLNTRRVGVDMPIGRLVEDPRAAGVLAHFAPDILELLEVNPLAAGASLRSLSQFSPETVSVERLITLDVELTDRLSNETNHERKRS